MIRATDETVRGWIRDGRLKAETHLWRGRPYYLIAQAEVDRMLQADRPFDSADLIGAGERGSSTGLYALAIGGLTAGGVAPGLHDHRHVLLLGVVLVAFLVACAVFWVLTGRLDRQAEWLVGPETDAPLHDDHGEAWL